jgi:hypothetical protein
MMFLPLHVRLHRRLLAVTAAASLGCSQSPPPGDHPAQSTQPARPGAALPQCREPLDALCRDCQTYDEALADLEKDCASSKVETSGLYGRIGTCGTYRYIMRGDSFIDATDYYDANGRLVSAGSASENIHNVCKGERQYGQVPACDRQPPARIVCGS